MGIEEIAKTTGLSASIITLLVQNPDLLKMIYSDIAQPSVIKLGKALEIVFGLSNTILLPIKLLNEKTRILFENNIRKFEEKLSKIPEKEISVIPSEIGIPIIECFTYVQDEELINLFSALLSSASDKSKSKYAHPAYINVIKNISPDEAIFIKNLVDYKYAMNGIIPISSIRVYTKEGSYRVIDNYFIPENILSNLKNSDNKNIYIENLQRQGILSFQDNKSTYESMYIEVDKIFESKKEEYASRNVNKDESLKNRHCIMQFTEFGLGFLKAVQLL